MNKKEEIFVGVDIGLSLILIHLLNTKGDYLNTFSIDHNNLTPGAFTVLLDEKIDLISQSFIIIFIVLFVPGKLDHDKRAVKYLEGWPGWCEVPLSHWLEIRLQINVFLVQKSSFLLLDNTSPYFLEINNNYSNHCEESVLL